MRRLWGRANSVNVQKALWALEELGLPYERVEAGGAHGVVDEPAYRTLNPNGLVPVLEEDGFALWESNAILRYLALAYPGPLGLPGDVRERARVDQWLDWQATAFTPAMRDAFWQSVRAADPDADLIAVSVAATERCAAVLDRHLDGRAFMVGDSFGIADIAVGCAAHRWLSIPVARIARPNLARWLGDIAARPAAGCVVLQALS